MDFDLIIDLFLDTTGPLKPARFLTSRASTNQVQGSALTLISSDTPKIRLFLLKPADALGLPADCLGHNGTIFLTLKAAPGNSTLLAVATGFTFVVDPVLGDHFTAVLDLNTIAIETEMETVERIDGVFDIELQAPANTSRLTFQNNFTIFEQVQQGDEEDPTPASAISSFIANAQDTVNGLVADVGVAVADAEAATAAATAATADTVAAIAAAEALVTGVSWGGVDGDELTVGGETSPPLTGPPGAPGATGAAGPTGAILGTAGVRTVSASGAFTITDSDNGKAIVVTASGATTATLTDPISDGFACVVIRDNATGGVTFANSSSQTMKQPDSFTVLRADGSQSSVIRAGSKIFLCGDFSA